jgi:hypothetical protein
MIGKFLLFLILTHFLVFAVSSVSLTFISVGMVFPAVLLVIYILTKLPRKIAAALLIIIFSHNLYKTLTTHYSVFKVQPGMTLRDERAIVEKTYQLAGGREFSVDTVTIPYQYPTLWAYLYQTAGKPPPYYRGLTAHEFAGRETLNFSDAVRPINFTIIEPRAPGNDSDDFGLFFFAPLPQNQ